MQQAEFWPWVGPPLGSEPAPPDGIFYLDNHGVKQNGSGSFGFHSATGEGLLYVDGDLTINSSFTFRGVVYVEGNITVNGQCWVLGAVIVKGTTKVMQNGGSTILYSSEAIKQALAKWGGQFVNLARVESTPPTP